MTNKEKAAMIAPWVNPEERVTVDFDDVQGLSAQISGCTLNVVYLTFQGPFPHIKERVTIPLRSVQVGEDAGHYTRDPHTPLQSRLRLRVRQPRPQGL